MSTSQKSVKFSLPVSNSFYPTQSTKSTFLSSKPSWVAGSSNTKTITHGKEDSILHGFQKRIDPMQHDKTNTETMVLATSNVNNTIERTQFPNTLTSKDRSSMGSLKTGAQKIQVHAETGQLKTEPTTSSPLPSNSAKKNQRQSPTVNACIVAEKLQRQRNCETHEHIRAVKYEVAKLREHLVKVEEEIKHLNKGRHTVELSIQDIRKALSVNQQSLSAQQKKRGNEESKMKLFHEEAQILLGSKRKLETHLQTIKHQLHSLDSARKLLQNKISSLSKALQLDAQNFKVYDGPVTVRPDSSTTKQRHYSTTCHQPKRRLEEEVSSHFLSSVLDTIQASQNICGEIKSLVTSAHKCKIEARKKINDALSQSIEEAKTQQRTICLEKGQLRLQHNAALHQNHMTEIALGIASGPIYDKFKPVSQREQRPLSRIRPVSAIEEANYTKETKSKLTRQLSATESRQSSIVVTDHKLHDQLQEKVMATTYDSQLLRVRKMALDNRWVS